MAKESGTKKISKSSPQKMAPRDKRRKSHKVSVRAKKQPSEWERLFIKHDILKRVKDQGFVDLRSSDFRFGPNDKIEIRLATKMDSSAQVPSILARNSLNVLALSADTWRVGFFDPFVKLPIEKLPKPTSISIPSGFESLDEDNITSEGQVISVLMLSGVLEKFVGEKLTQTISGKAKAGSFNFVIDGTRGHDPNDLSVGKFQYEVDAGFEGEKALYLIEAKNRTLTDFNMRQLYYPMRAWHLRVNKPIRTIFVNYSNRVFDVIEYEFSDLYNFSSSKIKEHRRFVFGSPRVSHDEIATLAARRSLLNPAALSPYPQADLIDRLMDLVDLLDEAPLTLSQIAEAYKFDERQARYYADAGKVLGLIEVIEGPERQRLRGVTSLGKRLAKMNVRERTLLMAQLILSVPPIADLYREFSLGNALSLVELQNRYAATLERFGVTKKTVKRRLQTSLAWARWLVEVAE